MSLTSHSGSDRFRQDMNSEGLADLSAQVAAFRTQYVDKLAAPHGWWAIASLDWLEPGPNLLGSAAGARLPLPAGAPARVATLELDGDSVTLTPLSPGLTVDGAPLEAPRHTNGVASLQVPLTQGGDGPPMLVKLLRRGPRFGVRVYDPRLAAARDRDRDVAWYDFDPDWVIDAEFVSPLPDETIEVVNALGQVTDATVMGRALFQLGGRSVSLVATASGTPGRLFFNFRDGTNLAESYGGGRFLNVDGPEDGRIVLDFNRCHHPPCAHTPYATCPIPPEENRLAFEVRAGERYADAAQPPAP